MSPSKSLEELEARHAEEEEAEAQRDLAQAPRPLATLPLSGRLEDSQAWLERLYRNAGAVREKKPPVVDHLRSGGPWLVSIDEPPVSVLDSMSQTATVCGGFAEDPVVRCYVEGGFGDTLLVADDTTAGSHPVARAYAEALRAQLPELPHVSFTNSGAEAMEKAFALCRARAPEGGRRLLAFEGSFHGRTLLALHASFNPTKRAPFEVPGHEVTYAPFPAWPVPHEPEPEAPHGYLDAIAEGDLEAARRRTGETDEVLGAELDSLDAVGEHLARGEYYAVVVEPMQSEGGDRYATSRFYKALRLLTRHHGVALVVDEVQTGFGLGGRFAWHRGFDLVDGAGNPDAPDCVAFAKRAQVGVVMSRWPDPEPTSAHPASMVRGLVHAQMMATDDYAAELQSQVRGHLEVLAERFAELVENPRCTGYALAFDLPSAEHLKAYMTQRWRRGAVIFGAGTRTVRYRLSQAFDGRRIDRLFESAAQSLEWMRDHPGEVLPEQDDGATAVRHEAGVSPSEGAVEVRRVAAEEADRYLDGVIELEQRVYEPGRQDPPERLRLAFDDPDGIPIVAEARTADGTTLVGYCLGAPLERARDIYGPDRDPMQGRGNTLYSIALTVDPTHQGRGLGRRLKALQLMEARARRRADGSSRYAHISGRNRVGMADAMVRLNRAFGAYGLYTMGGIYSDPEAESWYYRLPVGPFVVDPAARPTIAEDAPIRLDTSITRPFARPPESLVSAYERGLLFGAAVNKLTLSNYLTPAIVRAVEYLAALVPELPHVYLASSRDEAFDKTVRAMRWHRQRARVMVGLEGGYVGHTTAAARSLSDPKNHAQGRGEFEEWSLVPHPAHASVEATITALRDAIDATGGSEHVLGLCFEPVQERTGLVVPDGFWPQLQALRTELGIPIALVETATSTYRSGRGPFYTSGLDSFQPDALLWWGGGQAAFLHVADELFVDRPLTLVSTWDGDELSLIRAHHHARAARQLDVRDASARLDEALRPLVEGGVEVRGTGLYRMIALGNGDADALVQAFGMFGLTTRAYPNGNVPVAPTLDVRTAEVERIAEAVREVCR